jgi:hypothetical protein
MVILIALDAILIAVLIFLLASLIYSQRAGAPYVPIERKAMRRILEWGNLSPQDVVFDFGSGDGRVLIEAVRRFGARAGIGYEISWWPYFKSKLLLKKNGLVGKVKVERRSIFNIPESIFSDANVFYVYTSPETMKRLAVTEFPKMKRGSKIISPSFRIPDGDHNFHLVDSTDIGWHRVFIYEKIK